ncbi:hypothetical protein [Sinimarinibacterium thermocellulolyticum]|uniref:DUF7931 domain-containing protein n=1 Tax=Sinimarinibacterium thermocellulolyticum TaxID=3170016 RepID=A0ABV2A8A1_9GAMM
MPETVSGRAGYAAALQRLIAQARYELAILSHGFDAAIYGDEGLVERIKHFCLAHERARVRVLVNQPALAMRSAHRFVELARRLPSRIQFRQLDEADLGVVEEWVIADGRSLLQRASPEALQARYHADAPLDARLRLKDFDDLWARGVPAREFSELKI